MKKPVLALLFLLLPAGLVLLWLSLGKSERGQATNDSQCTRREGWFAGSRTTCCDSRGLW